jgi:hypothetical protein
MNGKTKDQIRLGHLGPGLGAAMRRRDGALSIGTFAEVKDGQPIPEGVEIIHVGASDDDGWRDVTTIYERGEQRTGPAQVATIAYHEGYDRIFGKKQEVGLS